MLALIFPVQKLMTANRIEYKKYGKSSYLEFPYYHNINKIRKGKEFLAQSAA
jgi:hypothetical protein